MLDSNAMAFEEAFDLLCGEKLGEGVCRAVFECLIDPTLVVKVEKDPSGMFQNAHEYRTWVETQHYRKASKWLAPCVSISRHGFVLLQKRVEPLRKGELPGKLPEFLNRDIKPSHFGMFEGRVVCCDYALSNSRLPMGMKAANWGDDNG